MHKEPKGKSHKKKSKKQANLRVVVLKKSINPKEYRDYVAMLARQRREMFIVLNKVKEHLARKEAEKGIAQSVVKRLGLQRKQINQTAEERTANPGPKSGKLM